MTYRLRLNLYSGRLRGADCIQHVQPFGIIEFPLDHDIFIVKEIYWMFISNVFKKANALLPVGD